MPLLDYPPLRTLYGLSALALFILRLPFLVLQYALPSLRQHRSYTFRQALGVRALSAAVYHQSVLHIKTPLPLTPGAEKHRFIVVKPANAAYYKGSLADEKTRPVDIGATWYNAPLTAWKTGDADGDAHAHNDKTLVVLHIHGGGFVVADGRTTASGPFASSLLHHTPATHILTPQYRLSTLPASSSPSSHAFPAALQDSLTAYLYLLHTLHIPPSRIILSGDSAGGNLAIALLRYIATYGSALAIPAPSAAWLWSPWTAPVRNSRAEMHANANFATDYLPHNFVAWGSSAYAGVGGQQALASPWVSAEGHAFRTGVPLWVNVGGKEVLYFDGVKWVEEMRDAGNDVTLDVEERAVHDILLFPAWVGFGEEARACARRAGEWVRRVRKAE
ncbi:Alpha/Beta hydrolase protein [Massariosphaeria phaeospora]|uniref:Alpha/Beta hydrolase protein n=1 Tax=Massariosphaeria phaeospora TaxID=100035 RepID=A0A7C8M6T2_9PLEO|nr:Alpha/Beta hydrolase protein [Massariosphaeria phaeospora]